VSGIVKRISRERHKVLVNQGPLAIAFFEVTALIVLLVLFYCCVATTRTVICVYGCWAG